MTSLYLIRHGQSISAVERTIANKGLSPLGVAQAERLRDRLAEKKEIAADVIISSTMLRARETAEIIAPALDLPIIYDSDVEEWRDGQAEEAFNLLEYEEKFNAVPFDQKPFFHIVPDAENWSQFMLRAANALNRIVQEYEGKNIVIVCHGGIIESSFLLFFGMTPFHLPRAFMNTRNTSITRWRKFSWARLPVSWVLESYNDITHLDGLVAHP